MDTRRLKERIIADADARELVEEFVCERCAEEFERRRGEFLPTATFHDYQALEVGLTEHGIQVWCRRHERNVVHLDLRARDASQEPAAEAPPPSPAVSSSAFQAHRLTRLE